MKTYIGVKKIEAEPMTRGDYNTYRGWQIHTDENPDDEGYHVKHAAGYTVLEYALGWRVLNKETQLYETLDAISWSFRGFINKNNDQLVKPTDPVRYLCPYPAKVITDHRGLIRNYYGY